MLPPAEGGHGWVWRLLSQEPGFSSLRAALGRLYPQAKADQATVEGQCCLRREGGWKLRGVFRSKARNFEEGLEGSIVTSEFQICAPWSPWVLMWKGASWKDKSSLLEGQAGAAGQPATVQGWTQRGGQGVGGPGVEVISLHTLAKASSLQEAACVSVHVE